MNELLPKVLVVDDEPANLIAFEAVLSRLNVSVLTASNGYQAQEKALQNDLAVILMDVMMPGLDGLDAAAHLRSREAPRKTPLIFVTAAHPDHRQIARAYELGAVDYMFKPVVPEILQAKVSVFVELFCQRELVRLQGQALERRVAERTQELALANQQLEKEVAERKQAEECLCRRAWELARSNDELQRFAYVASHDLKEPLRMVSNYVQLLQRRYQRQLGDEASEFIQFAVDGVRRMYLLIDDLIEYSRVGREVSCEQVDFNDVLRDALANLDTAIAESGAVIDSHPLPQVMGVKSNLVQLFQNLISNALKFRGEASPRVSIGCELHSDYCYFSFADNGIGIDPLFSDKIFEIFQRLHSKEKYPGSGIGLAVCKKIVQNHGGRIWFESSPGKGTIFHFTIQKESLSDRAPSVSSSCVGN